MSEAALDREGIPGVQRQTCLEFYGKEIHTMMIVRRFYSDEDGTEVNAINAIWSGEMALFDDGSIVPGTLKLSRMKKSFQVFGSEKSVEVA